MSKRLILYISIGLGLVALSGGIFVSLTPANSLLRWYNIDDAFYYYQVAQNVVSGHGFTFDQINLSNGFHPLWMAVCIVVFWLTNVDLILPLRALVVVSALFNAAASILLFRLLLKKLHPAAAVLGSVFWALHPSVYGMIIVRGLESACSAFFIILLLYLAVDYLDSADSSQKSSKRLVWIGLVGALTILARLDNVFLVGIIGFSLLAKFKKLPRQVITDMLILAVSVFLAWTLRLGMTGKFMNTYSLYPMLLVAVLLKPVVFFFSRLYAKGANPSRVMTVLRVVIAALICFLLEFGVLFLAYKFKITSMFSASIVVLDCALSTLGILIAHVFFNKANTPDHKTQFNSFSQWIKWNWKKFLQGGIAYGSPIAVLVGGYMLLSKLVFGTASPVSGQVKSWWGTLANTPYSGTKDLWTVLGLSPSASDGPWSLATSQLFALAGKLQALFQSASSDWIFGVLLLIAAVLLLVILIAGDGRSARKGFGLLLPSAVFACLIHITKYTATHYAGIRNWYWILETLVLVILGSLILDALFTWMDRWKIKFKLAPIVAGLGVIAILYSHGIYIYSIAPPVVPDELKADFLSEVHELEKYTDPNSRIGMTGSGQIGYFIQDRTIVNLDGLINSYQYFTAMKNGTAAQFLNDLGLDYVFGKPYSLLQVDPYQSIFTGRLEEIGYIRGIGSYTLFRYIPKP